MRLLLISLAFLPAATALAQNIGIGTNTPLARLHIVDSSVLFSASGDVPLTAGSVPLSGAGRRMLWYPDKAAFRVGYVSGTNWDKNNIGNYSFAAGYDSKAAGAYSVAMGNNASASGEYSTALGSNTTASGGFSVAMGTHTTASNTAAAALGSNTTASGYAAVAMGFETTASGNYSMALGTYVSTNGATGALGIGDNSTTTVMPVGANVFRARFASGYRFYTSADYSTSALLPAGANAWNTASDVRLKENFADVDGEDFLQKIAVLHLSSWNYKKQDSKTFRHYGPMAQEFFAAFGHDAYGTVGNDTTINQADFDGVNLIAIQALEKRTSLLKQENGILEEENKKLQTEVDELSTRLKKMERLLDRKN
jgi:hypothetical protein